MLTEDLDIYLVGGAVRDRLIAERAGQEADASMSDRDWVVVGASAQQLLDRGFAQIGRDFHVFLHPDTKEEYALARTERKRGSGHTGFDVDANPGVTLTEDLSRRDLTINAIAQGADGQLIDPHGGEADIAAGCLRHVSDAFVEDPLRVFRVARLGGSAGPAGELRHGRGVRRRKSRQLDTDEINDKISRCCYKRQKAPISSPPGWLPPGRPRRRARRL